MCSTHWWYVPVKIRQRVQRAWALVRRKPDDPDVSALHHQACKDARDAVVAKLNASVKSALGGSNE